ncbi:MAG: ABC transporter ATP-binding protein, partial [Longimicrobiales bacterium]
MSEVYEEEILGKAYDSRLMARLLRYIRPYKLQVAVAIALLMVASGLAVVGPYLTKIALDDAIPGNDPALLRTLAILYIVATVLVFALRYAQTLVTTWLGQRVMYDMRTEIFEKLQRLDLRFYDRNPVGRLMTRITSDVETLNELFSSGVVTVFGDLFTLFFIMAAMLQMDWELALVTFSVLPFVAYAAFLFRSRIRSAYRDIRVRLARSNAFLQERFTGVRVVQLFNREKADQDEFGRLNADYLSAHLRSITYYALFFPVIQLFTAIALAVILWYGGGSMIQGFVTIGVLAAFLDYARRFFRPIQDLSEKYNLLQGAMASSERVFRLLDREPEIDDPADPHPFPEDQKGEIRFEGVWFAYGSPDPTEGEPDWVIKDLSFTVRPGEKVAIVGHTGAGKTTIINLLMRFYEAQRGRILLDGVPIDEVAIDELRARVGLVLQDVFLFSRSVEYNVRMGEEGIE